MKILSQAGKFWISKKDLPKKEPLRSIMINILTCQPDDCKDKKAYMDLVKYCAKDIIVNLIK